jgi:hypothetical protein
VLQLTAPRSDPIERKRVEKVVSAFIKRRPAPSAICSQLGRGYRIAGRNLELCEISPKWDRPGSTARPLAKATCARTKASGGSSEWARTSSGRHGYDPAPEVTSIDELLAVVEQHEYGCSSGRFMFGSSAESVGERWLG